MGKVARGAKHLMKGTAKASQKRLDRLKKGYPLSTGATPAQPPATSGKRTKPFISAPKSGPAIEDRAQQTRALEEEL